MNDQINSVLARYEAFKRGETPPASIPAELLPGKNESLSLIDFDDSLPQAGSSSGAGSGNTTVDDLAGLFSSAPAMSSPAAVPPPSSLGVSPLFSNIVGQPTSTVSPQFTSTLSGPSQFGQIKLPSTPPLQNQLQASGRVGSSPLGANPTATSTPPPGSQASTPQGKDPFADLVELI
jgi:ADP-ribosylation factor-binding protein GGA